jgi:3-hydroxyacyl-CoA dehydrogenase
MSTQKSVQRIAIVGTGTIGASWATHYLAQGFDVTATDPAPGAERRCGPTSRVHGTG